MNRKCICFAFSLVVPALISLQALADPSRIFWSPSGTNLGSDRIRAYVGSSDITVMTAHSGGVLTAFSGTGLGHRIHWSRNGENLGGGPIVYDGSSRVTAMISYNGGVLTAFSGPQAGLGNRIHWSPNGQNLGGGPIVYDGSSPVTAMIPYNGGVLTAFTRAGPNGHRIHWSPNGQNLGGGPIVYDGSSPVTAMISYRGGVLTAFTRAGPNGNRIHWSPNGQNLGGGPIVYDGGSPVVAMIPYRGGVLTAFTNAGPNKNRIHWSADGQNLGGGPIRYDGSTVVRAMLAYNEGVFTAFQADDRGRACGGGDLICNLVQVIGVAGEQLRQVGRDIDRMRLEFQSSVFTGPALEQWLIASRNSAMNGAMVMPPEMRNALQGWYDPALMNKVRFKIGDGGELNLANNAIRLRDVAAVTLIDVIVFKGPEEAVCPSLWVHEMKHLQQFEEWGVHSFAVQYMRSWNGVEDPAYAVERQYAQANPQRC
jgi:hypothetical protein